jgi:hypothetical protein
VDETVPETAFKVIVLPNPDDAFVEISKPVGAVTKMLTGILVPLTVNACAVEAEPGHAENAASGDVLVVMVGL